MFSKNHKPYQVIQVLKPICSFPLPLGESLNFATCLASYHKFCPQFTSPLSPLESSHSTFNSLNSLCSLLPLDLLAFLEICLTTSL